MTSHARIARALVGAALGCAVAPAASAQCASDGGGYTVVPLTGLEGSTFIAAALNDAGQVAGTILPDQPGDPYLAFLWDDGVLATEAFPGKVVTVADVSEGGLVVGTARDTALQLSEIFVWDPAGGPAQIVPTAFEPFPTGINDARLVSGGDTDGTFGFALDATNGQVDVIAFGQVPQTSVGTLGASSVNDAGVVVGSEVVLDPLGFYIELPYRWTESGRIEQLAVVPNGFGGRGVDVADGGNVAGYVLDEFFTRSSALWTNDGATLTNLGSPPNFFVSDATALNVHDQVAVVAPNDLFGYTRGYLWEDGVWTDLSCFAPPGLFVARPLDLNDAGEVLVQLTDAGGLVITDVVILRPDQPFVEALEVVRPGSPPNPSVFLPGVTSGPVVGATWDPVIDHIPFLPTAVLDLAGVTLAPLNLALPPYGTLLCDVFSFPPYTFSTAPEVPFAIPIPNQASLVGMTLCAQGLSTNGSVIALTNALDLTLGNY